jgi:4-carboxymuconolactone decarboxylase
MARMPLMTPATMTPEQLTLAEAIAGKRSGVIRGPWAQIIRNPRLCALAAAYGDYLRGETSVPPRLAMIAVLMTARHWCAEYMWAAQQARAKESGLAPALIEAIRTGQRPALDDAADKAVYDLVAELYDKRAISDAAYAAAEKALGDVALVELLNIAGFYTTLAMVISATGIPSVAGAPTAFG